MYPSNLKTGMNGGSSQIIFGARFPLHLISKIKFRLGIHLYSLVGIFYDFCSCNNAKKKKRETPYQSIHYSIRHNSHPSLSTVNLGDVQTSVSNNPYEIGDHYSSSILISLECRVRTFPIFDSSLSYRLKFRGRESTCR